MKHLFCPFAGYETECTNYAGACKFYEENKGCKILQACDNIAKLIEFVAYMEAEEEERTAERDEKERHGL